MRLVPAPLGSSDADIPTSDMLERVRFFSERFPKSRLREVAIVRAPELDGADPEGDTRVWIALEALQVTGSFKVRGAFTALAPYAGKKARVVASSAGNHGIGIAYASHVLDVPATIVIPRSLPLAKREKLEAYGAEVIVADSDFYDGAEQHARDLCARTGSVFISPYDSIDAVLGNGASLGFEIVRALGGVPDTVVVPFGGGGLATGLACALADESGEPLAEVRRVWGVQSDASPAMAMSLEQGFAVERYFPSVPTLAEGLEGGISDSAFRRARQTIAGILVVGEDEISEAMIRAYGNMGMVLEGSAAIALVPVLTTLPKELRGGDLLVVLTGRNVDQERLEQVLTPMQSMTRMMVLGPDE